MMRKFNSLIGICVISAAISGCSSAGWNAVQDGDAAALDKILKTPNHGNENLDDLMFKSAQMGCFACVQDLLEAGAKPDYAFVAAVEGHPRVTRLLLDHGGSRRGGVNKLHAVWGATAEQTRDADQLMDQIEQEREKKPTEAAASPVVPQSAPVVRLVPKFNVPERPSDYALIVGVEKYDSLPAATYAEGDAATAADFVRALGVPARNVVTLTGAHATRSAMVKQLENWLAKNADENSTVYFYFSGHGAPDPTTGQAYLVPFDGDPQYLAETGYPLKRLYEKLGAIKSKRTIVMIDSCFSGAGGRSVLAKGARPLVNNVDTGISSSDGKIDVLTASGANQISGTNDEQGHGLFTYYLFTGLNGAASDSDGHVTLQSLFNYLKPKVMDDARRANREQTPQLQAGEASVVVLREK